MSEGYDYLMSRHKIEQDKRLARPMVYLGRLALMVNNVALPKGVEPIFSHKRVNARGALTLVPKITTLKDEKVLNRYANILRKTGMDEMPQAELVPDQLYLSGTARIMTREDEDMIISNASSLDPNLAEEWYDNIYPLNRSIISTDSLRGHIGRVDYNNPEDCVKKLRADLKDLETVNPNTNRRLANALIKAIFTGQIKDNRDRQLIS